MRAFILGNSGELLDHDLSLLQGETVFGCNALPLRCPEIITHYVCLDIGMAFVPEVRALVSTSCHKYYSRLLWNTIDHEDNVNVYDTWNVRLIGFEASVEKMYEGMTVTYIMLQLAVALGYDELYLLGIDLGLPANGIQHIPEQEVLLKIMKDKNLRPPLDDKSAKNTDHVGFNKPVQTRFIYARDKMKEMGVSVYNLSKGGNLNCFPRKCFEEVVTNSHDLSLVVNSNHETEIVSDVELTKGE